MTTPNPTPARDAVTAAIDAVWESRSIADRRAAINALITAARADERAQLAARATEQERELVGRLMAAGRDERLSTGALYLEAAGVITTRMATARRSRSRPPPSA